MHVSDAAVTGRLGISGSGQLLAGGPALYDELVDEAFDLEAPEEVEFTAEGRGAPMILRFGDYSPWVLRNLSVEALAFSKEVPTEPGETMAVSAISSGMLTLHDVAQEVALRTGDHLSLSGVNGRVVELELGERISLLFEGRVSGVETGPDGFETDLKPSMLAYTYHQQLLYLFASGVAFLWTVVWSVRRTMFA